MKIRVADLHDVAKICLLYDEFFANNAKIDPVYCRAGKESGEYPKSVIESNEADLIVAVSDESDEGDNELVGFIHIREGRTPPYDALMQNHYAQIIDFIVTEEQRKKGIGKLLMDAAKDWAKQRKLDYIELFVLDGAKAEHRFYENNDFVPVFHTLRCML